MGEVLERKWQGIEGKFNNFEIERYRNRLNRKELPNDLVSLMTEMEVMRGVVGGATLRQMMLVPGEGFFHQIGDEWVRYTEFFERAIDSTDDSGVKERFGAERIGWERAERALMNSENQLVVMASPPGEIYRFNNKKPLSATFVLARGEEVRVQVQDRELEGIVFDAFAIYIDEISVEEHLQIVERVGEFVENLEIITPLSLVAMPLIMERVIDNLDQLVQGLGFDSWEEVEQNAVLLNKLYLENWKEKEMRRGGLIMLMEELVDMALNDPKQFDLGLVGKIVDITLAKEVYGYYVDKNLEAIRRDIQLMIIKLHKGSRARQFVAKLKIDPFTYYTWEKEQESLLCDAMFQRMMSAHGGGGMTLVDSNGQFMSMDIRTNQLVNREKEEVELKCGDCGHSFRSKRLPCLCPKCKHRVSKGGE